MEIVDNFLSEHDCNFITSNSINNIYFPFYLMTCVSKFNSKDGSFFIHKFMENNKQNSNFLKVVTPILNQINSNVIYRVQLNLYPKTFFKHKHGWHTDKPFEHKGLIYYLNSNNGTTDLKGEAKVKSVRNRALFFNPSKSHRSTTCTDQEFRANIIINYN